jgi:hypothetical protein
MGCAIEVAGFIDNHTNIRIASVGRVGKGIPEDLLPRWRELEHDATTGTIRSRARTTCVRDVVEITFRVGRILVQRYRRCRNQAISLIGRPLGC